MRFVDRAKHAAPAWLGDPSEQVANERAAAADYYAPAGKRAAYPFTQYKNYAVGLALGVMFDGKCAYCESEVGAPNDEEIEHYRPKGGVADDKDYRGYWWLASEWSNLLMSCTGCNQGRRQHLITAGMTEADYLAQVAAPPRKKVGKHQQFPVGGPRAVEPTCDLGLEQPLLIDPTVTDPKPALRWTGTSTYSIVLPAQTGGAKDVRGAATIDICALNRSKLVKARTKLLNQLRLKRTRMFEALERDSGPVGTARAVEIAKGMRELCAHDLPYSAMADAYVGEVMAELADWLAKRRAGL